MRIFVIGGANLDIYAKVDKDTVVLYDSNPAHVSFSYGGVARNIVENIANMHAEPYFVSIFGKDAMGQGMYNDLKNKGVKLDYSIVDEKRPTSSYLAILNADDMYVACSDMTLIENMKVEQLEKLKDVIQEDDYVVFDANLSVNIINYICVGLKGIKIFDAISTTKVTKINDLLDNQDIGIKEVFIQEVHDRKIPLDNPEITLFMIIELVSSTVSSSIVDNHPLPIDEFKPHLFHAIRLMINEKPAT